MFEDNWATFAASYTGHFRLTATLASAHCATSLPKLAQIHFNSRPHLLKHMWTTFGLATPWLAFVDCATFLRKVDRIWLPLFGPYLLFTTWATLGSHSDYTLPWTPHLCLQRPTCDLIHLGIFAILHVGHFRLSIPYIHFVQAKRRPAVLYHCLKWPTSACYLGSAHKALPSTELLSKLVFSI